jgi:hypothetical protein
MNPETIAPEYQMMQFILANWISKPIHVAAKLGLADLLGEKNISIEEIAGITGTLPGPLYRMMRALAGVGIFAETDDGLFGNTPLSQCLTQGRLKAAALMFHSTWHDAMWDNLLFSLQTGKPAFEEVCGAPAFEWFQKNPRQAEIFNEANAFKAAFSHGVIAQAYDFSSVHSITDVGGGLGSLMVAILKAHPHLEGVVADLPETAKQADGAIQTHQLQTRMRTVACDFFEDIPRGSDTYLLSNVLHDWPDDKCVTILNNCREVMKPQGKLLIVEAIVPEGNVFSVTKLLDLEVFLMGGGCERTEAEFGTLLDQSGFKLTQVIATEADISIIEGTPT